MMMRSDEGLLSERGFALVGVVMFVLVLTILGLSLFSLSTIEGQFLNQSNSRAEAFYAASEGLERSRFVLSSTADLGSVKDWLVVDGSPIVKYAVAMQLQASNWDSLGAIEWNGNPITVRVLAVQRGQQSFLEMQLQPIRPENLYRRLFTLSNDLTIPLVNPDNGFPTRPQVRLTGQIWKNGPKDDWIGSGATLRPGTDVVPAPQVASYIGQHWNDADEVTPAANGTYSMIGGLLTPAFYKTVGMAGPWSLQDGSATPQIQVSGKVIWLIPKGARFDQTVTVTGLLPTDALIMVAGKNDIGLTDPGHFDAEKGIAFKSAFRVLPALPLSIVNIPVILVSDGTVSIEHKVSGTTDGSYVPFLSVYARDAYLLGPHSFGNPTGERLWLEYPTGPLMEDLLELLYGLRLLPNTNVGADGTLPPIAGSWRDLDLPDPS